jgi:DNA repair protein RecO (recombination protein O)
MPENRSYQTEAIIVKKIKLGEADRILSLYTLDHGRIEAVAKGIRRPRSKLAGHLELLTYSRVTLVHGRNLDTVIGSQTLDSFMDMKNDIWLTSYGLYASELINLFTAERIENRELFQLLLVTLGHLSHGANPELVLRYFELHLLDWVGYRPQLQVCVTCQVALQPAENAFCSRAGGVLCPDCAAGILEAFPISVNALKVFRLMQRSDISVTDRLKISSELSSEIKAVMATYISYLLEKEVKSAGWLTTLRDQINQLEPGYVNRALPEPGPSPGGATEEE